MIPERFIDRNRRLNLLNLMDVDSEWFRATFPNGLFIRQVAPHMVPYDIKDEPPTDWLREHVTGYWYQWAFGIHFSNWQDAFEFKMRWI